MNYSTYSRRAAVGAASLALLGAVLLATNSPSPAQIPQSGGSSHMESRSSGMGSTPDPAASAVHESHKPQSKESGQGNARGKTAGQGQKAEGAGGFSNGLYGTGAGSNR
ncbi:hypothetical protein QF000_002312 [Paraburkholderia atlantica]|uniref:beta-xylosidase n=1 Tax=Paraburkholderia atlantica TaxID=2654982 RepID=UPI003D1B03F5